MTFYLLHAQVLDPTQRLGAGVGNIQAIKAHVFFDDVDFATIFSVPVPARESGLVGPPEPIRTDFFAGLGLGEVQSEGDDGSEDEMDNAVESDFDDAERFEPPKNRWGTKSHHGNGGSVSSGSTMGASDVTTPVNGVGLGRPWSSATETSVSSAGSARLGLVGEESERIVSGPWASPAAKDQRLVSLLFLLSRRESF